MARIGIVGTTGWATTLGILSANAGNETILWARSEANAQELESARENVRLLPDAGFPDNLAVSASADAALAQADIVIVSVPSLTMRQNLQAVRAAMPQDAVVLCATKGIEISSGKRMSQLIVEELDTVATRVGMLSGPNLAPEIASGHAASATVAFSEQSHAQAVQSALNSSLFRLYTSTDVTGVELGGALKNIIAIGSGFIDGVDMGANLKATFVTRGLHEITRLGVAMGARPETFAGLSGMGDLIATCYSPLSRNYRLGLLLAKGADLDEALTALDRTAEGVPTTKAAVRLAEKHDVEMPIALATNEVFEGRLRPEDAAGVLLARRPQPEVNY